MAMQSARGCVTDCSASVKMVPYESSCMARAGVFLAKKVEMLFCFEALKDVNEFHEMSASAMAPARLPSPAAESNRNCLAIGIGTPSRSPRREGECWWRRRESNPRPKSSSARRIHAQSSSENFALCAQNGQDAHKTSPIISRKATRTELLTPACCATPARGPQAKPRQTAAFN